MECASVADQEKRDTLAGMVKPANKWPIGSPTHWK